MNMKLEKLHWNAIFYENVKLRERCIERFGIKIYTVYMRENVKVTSETNGKKVLKFNNTVVEKE